MRTTTNQPWSEKYRPRRMKDVVHHERVKRVLGSSHEKGDVPHLLFHGPPGTGKTSTILALARTLFGDDNVGDRVLELNASDERSLDVVRDKIKTFSRMSMSTRLACPPIKLVILDEADTMTADAQSALRRTMETHAAVTRFCLVCNYASKVIAPIASRCAKFRFGPLSAASMKSRLLHICERESVIFEGCSKGVLDAIVGCSGGDMRKAVNLLQTVSQLRVQTPACVVEIAGEIPGGAVDDLWSAVTLERTFQPVADAVSAFVAEGYSVGKILAKLLNRVVLSRLRDSDKAAICAKLMQTDRCLNDGADEELQLLDLCCTINSTAIHAEIVA